MSIRWWHWLPALCLALALEGLLVWAFGVFTTESMPAGEGPAITRIGLGRPLGPVSAVSSGPAAAATPTLPSAPAAAPRVRRTPDKASESPALSAKSPARPEVSTKLFQIPTAPRKTPPTPAKPQSDATNVPVDATLSHLSTSELVPDPAPASGLTSGVQARTEPVQPGMAVSAPASLTSGPSINAAAIEVEKKAYRAQLVARLAAKRRYPVLAQRSGQEGEVAVSFELAADGSVRSRRLVTPSGYALLDQAGLATVDRASPFPAVPDAFGTGPFRFTVPLRFDLR